VNILEEILEKVRRVAQEAEAFHLEQVDTPVRFEANQLTSIDTRELRGVALRIIKDGRVGFSATTDLTDLDALVQTAVETAPFGAEAKFQFPEAQSGPTVPVFDPAVGDLPLDRMVRLGQQTVDGIRAFSDEVLVSGSVSRSCQTVTLMNSRGGYVRYAKSGFGIGFEGSVVRGTDMLFLFDSLSGCSPIGDSSPIVASIIRQLEYAKHTATTETKSMPVVLMPTAIASVVLSPILVALNGKTVVQGTSPLADKLGQQVASPAFSVVNDPTLPFVPGSRPSDDEGVVSKRVPLIDKGVVANFLYDLQAAGQANAESTGSGERGLGSLPSPASSVLVVSEGQSSFEQMLSEIGEGLIVERLLGAGQGNMLGGDFNANVLLGYKVEGGQVVGRVKDTMVHGNAYKALENLIAVGSQGRWVGGGLYTPSISCADIAVATKA
jgi:PmbA protein